MRGLWSAACQGGDGVVTAPAGQPEHVCVSDGIRLDGEWYLCSNGGYVYGPCEDPECGGCCEYKSDCRCECHREL